MDATNAAVAGFDRAIRAELVRRIGRRGRSIRRERGKPDTEH